LVSARFFLLWVKFLIFGSRKKEGVATSNIGNNPHSTGTVVTCKTGGTGKNADTGAATNFARIEIKKVIFGSKLSKKDCPYFLLAYKLYNVECTRTSFLQPI
jgi:hypothetical protein